VQQIYRFTIALPFSPPLPLSARPLPGPQHYNPYFPGQKIQMPNPLYDGGVEYEDGTPATASQARAPARPCPAQPDQP
jgi:cytochrome c1